MKRLLYCFLAIIGIFAVGLQMHRSAFAVWVVPRIDQLKQEHLQDTASVLSLEERREVADSLARVREERFEFYVDLVCQSYAEIPEICRNSFADAQ